MAFYAISFCVNGGQFDNLVLVSFQVLSFRHFYAYVCAVGGVKIGLGGEAFVTAVLFHGCHYGCLKHAGSAVGFREFHAYVGVAACVKDGLIEGVLRLCEIGRRIRKRVALEVLERRCLYGA